MRTLQAGSLQGFLLSFVLTCAYSLLAAAQQSSDSPQQSEAFCGFDDGNTMKLQYSAAVKNGEMHDGRMWEPGGAPMTLFTQTVLMIGGVQIPAGAYSVYVLPRKNNWTMVVNKNVAAKSKYDEKQDLVRVPMESVAVDSAFKSLEIAFAHTAPKACNLRMYYGKTGAFAEFLEK